MKLTRRTGIAEESQLSPDFVPYKRAAEAYRKALVSELANQVGGGTCGVMAAGMIGDAAYQKAIGTYLMDRAVSTKGINAGMAKMGSSMLNDARQNTLAAFEVCGKIAGKRVKGAVDGALFVAQQKFQAALAAAHREQSESARAKSTPIVVEGNGE